MAAKGRILVVEDELFLRDIYVETLTGAGYEVVAAEDGAIGWARLQEGGYDLVLMDVMLPEKDGRQLILDLQSHPPQQPIKRIAYMTNLSHEGIKNEGEELGVVGYMIKSDMTPDQFLEKVEELLAK